MWNTTAGKYAVVLSALALASFSAPARAGARFGLEVGANVSSLRYTDANGIISAFGWDPGWRASFTGGASVEFPWRRTVSVMTGLRYVQQGDKVEFGTSGPVSSLTGEFRISQNYLAVPLLLAFRPFPSPRCFLAAGPEGAVLLSGKASTEFSSGGLPSDSHSITHNLKPANLSLDAEAGLEFPAEGHAGLVILRYTHGLIDTQEKNDWAIAWKTRGVEALVGMRW